MKHRVSAGELYDGIVSQFLLVREREDEVRTLQPPSRT